jgi:mono/diheme cytochrome c family protein
MPRAASNFACEWDQKSGRSVNKYWVGAFAACVALLIASASSASPSEKLSFGPGRPVPPGNALKGQHTFDAICWACHSHDLSGGKAPPLTGPAFTQIWQGRKVDALANFIRNSMPRDDPGFLSDEMARDLVAYIVAHANNPGTPAGGKAGK